ncbi:MAG: hypothetical protein ACPGVC_08075 [Salibacteraceae bacterium]
MRNGMIEASKWTKDEYTAKIKAAEALIHDYQNPKTTTLNSGGDTPLSDVCYVYEGIFNFNFGDLETPNEFVEHIEEYFTVNINMDGNGDYFLQNQEVLNLYAELQSMANTEIDPTNSEFLLFCDLKLESVDVNNTTAVVRASMSVALQKPLPMTPNGPYFGANLAGPCANPAPNTTDAATYIDAYWQDKIKTRVQNLQANSTNGGVYYFVAQSWNNLNPYLYNNQSYWVNNVFPYFWKSVTNDCLGKTNNEWYKLYSDSDILAQEAVSYVISIMPAFQTHPFEPVFVNYTSMDYGPNFGLAGFPHIRYCHSGNYTIGYFHSF